MENTINQIKETIQDSISAISHAKNKRYEAKRKVDNDYYNETSSHKQNLINITDKYKDIAQQLAEEQRIAPYSRSGSFLEHDEAKVNHEGVHLTWDAEDHWNRVYHTFSWEEILEADKNKTNYE